jgi:hypothetical protein
MNTDLPRLCDKEHDKSIRTITQYKTQHQPRGMQKKQYNCSDEIGNDSTSQKKRPVVFFWNVKINHFDLPAPEDDGYDRNKSRKKNAHPRKNDEHLTG